MFHTPISSPHALQRAETPDLHSARFSWTQAPDLMARLTTAQNALRAPIDIMTFAGMCDSRAELERHVTYYEGRVGQQVAA